jgi:hypothetical protein
VLRQLLRLTRPLPAAGEDALAIAVYAGVDDTPIEARESGFEGVACVDDAARALEVVCDAWTRTGLPWVERWARGLLAFVLWMQEEDGRWLNFVVDWDGTKNESGITSVAGENFWHARATSGVERAWRTLGDADAASAFHRGFEHALAKPAPPDVRSLHIATALQEARAGSGDQDALDAWCVELLSCRHGSMLMNSPYERGTPHLWAHIQEGVLAEAGALLGNPRFVEAAVRSGEALLVPVADGRFSLPTVTPYDAASVAVSADGLAAATGDGRWGRVADAARAWFDGTNSAGAAVYDRERGRVGDGVDGRRLNQNSGAEANIVAAQVLPEDAARVAASLEGDPLARALTST